jgi:TM2 domain-containing membrane protein YozV
MIKTKTAGAGRKPTVAVERPRPRNTIVSYVLLAVLGIFGAHRFYHRRLLMAAAQIFLTFLVVITFGSQVGTFLALIMIGWLIADAATIKKWNVEDGLLPADA